MIYFDSAATTLQKPPQVYEAVKTAMQTLASPGRGGYEAAMRADEAVYDCRTLAAALFDAKPEQIVFTMNATHALNLAIKTLVSPGERVVISGFEHNAVVRPLHKIGAQTIVAGKTLFSPEDTLRAFDQAVTEDTKAVVCTHVSNVFGYELPVQKISDICRARGVPFVLDASQSAGILSVSLKKLHAAFLAMPGHKGLYGAQGTGILVCGRLPETIIEGGTGSVSALAQMPDFLPDRAEAGTPNVCGICALREGLRFLEKTGIDTIAAHERALQQRLVQRLAALEGVRVFSAGHDQTGVVSFVLNDEDCEQTASRLAARGVCVRAGLHCAPLAHKSAGSFDTGTVRVSISAFNTEAEIDALMEILKNP